MMVQAFGVRVQGARNLLRLSVCLSICLSVCLSVSLCASHIASAWGRYGVGSRGLEISFVFDFIMTTVSWRYPNPLTPTP
jgi:hypothetical protein